MHKIIKQLKDRGLEVGIFTDTIANMQLWKEAGVKYMTYSVDGGIFYEACNKLVHEWKMY